MKTKSLKTFTKAALCKKMRNDLKLTSLHYAARMSTDIAHFAQMHYHLNKNPEKSSIFGSMTNVIIDDNNLEETYVHKKYVEWLRRMDSKKDEYRDEILALSEELGFTFYKIAKILGTNQSNVNQFFKKGNKNAIAIVKLKKLLKHMTTIKEEKEQE